MLAERGVDRGWETRRGNSGLGRGSRLGLAAASAGAGLAGFAGVGFAAFVGTALAGFVGTALAGFAGLTATGFAGAGAPAETACATGVAVVSSTALGPSMRMASMPATPTRTITIARIRTGWLTLSIPRAIGIGSPIV